MPIIRLTILLLSLATPFFAQAATFDQVSPSGLTKQQAQQVLMLVLKHERFPMKKLGVFIDGDLKNEQGKPPHAGYFDFSVGYDSPKASATEYWGLFSVSIATGDVWEQNLCKRYSFPALTKVQQKIMSQTRQTLAGEKTFRQGLGCDEPEK